MPENRRGKRIGGGSGGGWPNSVDGIQEGVIRWLKIGADDRQDGEGGYPQRPGLPDCVHYLRTGACGYGNKCRFNHPPFVGNGQANAQVMQYFAGELPERVGQPDCLFFLKTGICKFGASCKYNHPPDKHGVGQVLFNTLGLPMRQEERSCPYYMRYGSCKFGAWCKFHHPEPPTSAGTVLPNTGPAYGSTASSIVPSSGLPYAGGHPTWSLPRATYISGPPCIQGTQTYMPAVLPPSQGLAPGQGWNTYMGTISPISSASILGESAFNGQVQSFSTSMSHLPDRPDQPECRYFLSTGGCNYGSDCKYHHPREKIAQLAAASIGPLGLPLRPGRPVCSYYSLYGLCRFGPTCKFDHPMMGYSYNYSLGLPTLSMLDQSLFNYQRSLPVVHSSETSPSKLSKFPDWKRKPEAGSRKSLDSDIKTPEDSSVQSGSPSHSSPVTSEHVNQI